MCSVLWSMLVLVSAAKTQVLIEPDCLTADGSIGYCTEPNDCMLSYQRPVLCRYSRGYGSQVCCPRSLIQNNYSYTSASEREDVYNNDEPIAFPGESNYGESNSYNHQSSSHNYNPSYNEDSNYQPYNTRPTYTKPQYHEKPSYTGNSYSPPTYINQQRPNFSYGSHQNSNPSYNEREPPNTYNPNQFQQSSNPSFGEEERPNSYRPRPPQNSYMPFGEEGGQNSYRPSQQNPYTPFSEEGRPDSNRPRPSQQNPYAFGEEEAPNSYRPRPSQQNPYNPFGEERPNSNRPRPTQQNPFITSGERPNSYNPNTEFGTGNSDSSWQYQNRPDRRTTPRPSWAVDTSKESTSNNNKRISELKCEEYSRPVSQTIGVLPLSLDAEAVPLKVQKCDFSAVKLIVGGEASELGEFPHMAAVGYKSRFSRDVMWNCGGTLISEQFIMTAAHCTNTTYGDPVVVRLGEYNLERDNDGADPEDYPVQEVIIHPNYFKSLKYNDIALIRLSQRVRFNKMIRPACLSSDEIIREKPMATGWGRTDYAGKLSDILRKVSLSLIDNQQCNSFYKTNNPGANSFPSGIVDTMLCAGEIEGGRDTCMGDSGGPLSITKKENPCIHYIIGITSFGKICAAPKSPGVYTKVSKFLPWIERTVWS